MADKSTTAEAPIDSKEHAATPPSSPRGANKSYLKPLPMNEYSEKAGTTPTGADTGHRNPLGGRTEPSNMNEVAASSLTIEELKVILQEYDIDINRKEVSIKELNALKEKLPEEAYALLWGIWSRADVINWEEGYERALVKAVAEVWVKILDGDDCGTDE